MPKEFGVKYKARTESFLVVFIAFIPGLETEINDGVESGMLTTRHPSIRKSRHKISPTSGGRSVSIVRLRTKGHRVSFSFTAFRQAEWTQFQTNYYSENLVVPGILPRISGSVARNCDH
jgi:hypothetical protein